MRVACGLLVGELLCPMQFFLTFFLPSSCHRTIPTDSGNETGLGLDGYDTSRNRHGAVTSWDDHRRHNTLRGGPERFSKFSWEQHEEFDRFEQKKCSSNGGALSISDVQNKRNERYKTLARIQSKTNRRLRKGRGPTQDAYVPASVRQRKWELGLGGRGQDVRYNGGNF